MEGRKEKAIRDMTKRYGLKAHRYVRDGKFVLERQTTDDNDYNVKDTGLLNKEKRPESGRPENGRKPRQ